MVSRWRAARGRRVVVSRVMVAFAACLVMVAAGSLASVTRGDADDRPPEEVPFQRRHLPTSVNAPGTWSDEERVPGAVAALGISTRTRTKGVFDDRESLALFAVSAVDGGASWLRLPGFSLDRWGFSGGFDVSPDGQWIGWVRPGRPTRRARITGRLRGFAVMNTASGEIRHLNDPNHHWLRGTMADLDFSGDSRYLLTSYETPDRPAKSRSRAHQLVAWDVEDGTATVVEPPGHYWLPSLGSAPTGVVWARGRTVFRVDPVTGERSSLELPRHVITASWGPDDTGFAYIGRPTLASSAPWRLYAGTDVDRARNRALPLPDGIDPSQILGWRDETHVVVGHHRRTVHVVDVVTGAVEEIDMSGRGEQVNAPYLADALWQQPLISPAEPDHTTDPRRPWRWAGLLILVVAAGLLLIRRRRHRAVGRH